MKYIKKTLSNGMTIVLAPNKHTQIITMGFFVKVGSRNETEENNGIAHFLEHMMFKGTEHRSVTELFNELDNLGSVYNAATTTQMTYYYIYGNADDTKKLLDIILDMYLYPRFETREINREKKVIIEEMRMTGDSPLRKLYTALHKKLFVNTSLSRNIIGTEDTIMNFKKKDFVDFRKTYYKPNNTVFVMAGNFNPVIIYKMLERILNPLQNNSLHTNVYCDEKAIILDKMRNQEEPYVYIKQNPMYQQIYALLVFPMYDLYTTNSREIDMLAQLLASGFSSRLSKSLREKNGITYSSSAYPIAYVDCSLFVIQLVINPVELINGLKIIMKELKKLKKNLITKEERLKIIHTIKNETIYAMVKPVDILTYYGINFLMYKNFKPDLEQELSDLKKITRITIQKIANQIFIRNKINLYLYGNINVTDYEFLDL